MEFILIGQPNCGKSTIFNNVAGYKSIASNFPGATVKFTKGNISLYNKTIGVTDLPGTYSLQSQDEAEKDAVTYLINHHKDVVLINVIDASVLSRSLELTLQLMELSRPMIIVLNMMDEARAKGIRINKEELTKITGLPVIETVAKKGEGIKECFDKAYEAFFNPPEPKEVVYSKNAEICLGKIESILGQAEYQWPERFCACKVLEKDSHFDMQFKESLSAESYGRLHEILLDYEAEEERGAEYMISFERHAKAFEIFESVSRVGSREKKDFKLKLDNIFMHPVLGYIFMIMILYSGFWIIFKVGNLLEPMFLNLVANTSRLILAKYGTSGLTSALLTGAVEGIGGGVGIVIPYLVPFFIFLAFLEDTGYLARIAYLLDGFMHKIGLHGTSVVPMILGYGCSVPGVLATRILKTPRDKFITATLTSLIPCSARMTVIFGLVGFFISMKAAVAIYVLNLVIIAATGKFLSKAMPEVSPGLILEIPRYNIPPVKVLAYKSWFRLKEFILVAWPLLILGSVLLKSAEFFHLDSAINNFLSPFTIGILGLPAALGVTMLFGLMRKELSLILLFSALGTSNVLLKMTGTQVFTFSIFITFYIPCLATIAALARELNWKKAILISLLTFSLAIILGVASRFIVPFFTA